ncbi:MAG: hypothetical protein QMD09_01220 [Desulfatibacillaceae bacterium]|nr:hypothetical protein [Desulfatibacillaceae bacterium]
MSAPFHTVVKKPSPAQIPCVEYKSVSRFEEGGQRPGIYLAYFYTRKIFNTRKKLHPCTCIAFTQKTLGGGTIVRIPNNQHVVRFWYSPKSSGIAHCRCKAWHKSSTKKLLFNLCRGPAWGMFKKEIEVTIADEGLEFLLQKNRPCLTGPFNRQPAKAEI